MPLYEIKIDVSVADGVEAERAARLMLLAARTVVAEEPTVTLIDEEG